MCTAPVARACLSAVVLMMSQGCQLSCFLPNHHTSRSRSRGFVEMLLPKPQAESSVEEPLADPPLVHSIGFVHCAFASRQTSERYSGQHGVLADDRERRVQCICPDGPACPRFGPWGSADRMPCIYVHIGYSNRSASRLVRSTGGWQLLSISII